MLHFILKVNRNLVDNQSMTLTAHHRDELEASGLTEETIKASGIRSISQQEAAELLGFDPRCGGMEFPYPETDFHRFKPDEPHRFADGRTAKYLQPKGSENRLYIPSQYDAESLADTSIPIILTEGEKKTLKGAQDLTRYLVVGLAGVWSFKNRGSESLITDFDRIAWHGREVFSVFDSDAATNLSIQKAEEVLRAKLRRKGAEFHVCRIPAG